MHGENFSDMVLKMETINFGKSQVSQFTMPGMRQLKNKGPWELKDGRFCDPTHEKRVCTSQKLTSTKDKRASEKQMGK